MGWSPLLILSVVYSPTGFKVYPKARICTSITSMARLSHVRLPHSLRWFTRWLMASARLDAKDFCDWKRCSIMGECSRSFEARRRVLQAPCASSTSTVTMSASTSFTLGLAHIAARRAAMCRRDFGGHDVTRSVGAPAHAASQEAVGVAILLHEQTSATRFVVTDR
jgi:hypothetical protein